MDNTPKQRKSDRNGWSLSIEEQGEITRLIFFERQLVRSALHMLRGLNYTPDVEDVKAVVSSFILATLSLIPLGIGCFLNSSFFENSQ